MKKLLTLLCVIALLGAMCVPAFAAESTVPVAAEVPADWTNAYLYAWGSAGEMQAWPGVAMTNVDGWWCAYMPDDMENVIINNGTVQTPDLAVDPGLPVCIMMATDVTNPEVMSELPIEVPSAEELGTSIPTVGAGATVHAYVPADWADCTLYAWGDNGDNGGWPGMAMTLGDDGLWTAELGAGYKNIIIASGNGSIQTIDLAYAGGECWVALKDQDAGGKFNAAVVYEEPEDWENVEGSGAAPVPTSDVWYVAGTMNNWTCNDEAYKMTDNGDGSFSFTFAITAGSHALKVTNGTWDVSFGGSGADGNYEFTANADGDITVNYDGNGVVTVTGDITEGAGTAEPTPVTGPLYVAGTMNDWTCDSADYQMTDNGNGTFSLVLDLTAGAHSLKVTNGTWDVSFGGDGENGNYDFNLAADGKVTVTFDGTTVNVTEGESAPVVTEPTTGAADNTTQPTTGAVDTTDDGEGGSMTTTIIIAVAVVLVGAVVVFLILKKK